MVYVAVTSLVLFFLNVYAATNVRTLMFTSKDTAAQDKLQLVASSFSGVESLSPETAEQVITVLGDLNVTRLLITDAQGVAIYDTREEYGAQGNPVPIGEVRQALDGYRVFHSYYRDGVLETYAAIPILVRGEAAGSVYLMEIDAEQGRIISNLETSILRSSLLLEALILVTSVVFSITGFARMRKILTTIRMTREGEYSHKIKMRGHDEYTMLATEFNKLTQRLQESEEAQRQFVSDASHELKTPLASIKLLSDSILQNDMDAATMREFVSDIGSEAERLNRMSQKLLTMSRSESDLVWDHEVVDVGAVVSRVFRMLVPLADQKEVRLSGSWEQGCTVLSIEDDIYQILFNLVENGIKYNHPQGSVHVSMIQDPEDICIIIEDTGVGIPQEALSHIFERFYRVDKARSRQAGGAGLGLSIVRELVERNYGRIQIRSQVDQGSCFTVTFPYFEVDKEAGEWEVDS